MPGSLRDIARKTGLSVASVSQALRGEGRLSDETRERVQAAAQAMGYQPDPLLSKAFSRVRQTTSKRYRETMALILEWPTETGPDFQKRMHKEVLDRATAMGYALDGFVISGRPSEHRRLSQILHARGIRGVIIIPRLGTPQPRLHLEWKHFASVEIGRTLWHPRSLHRVETAGYQKVVDSLHLLKKVGYRRIGMVVEPDQNRHQNGVYYAAYLLSQMRQAARQRLPIYAPDGTWDDEAHFRGWMEQNNPDVLFAHLVPNVTQWLTNMGLRVPEDISLFGTNLQVGTISGLRRDALAIARSAVDMLSVLLQNNELGLPSHPRCLQVDELWQAGNTLSRPIGEFITEEGSLRI